MKICKFVVAAGASLLLSAPLSAAESVASMPEMAGARLSPDGSHMAYLRPHQGQTSVAIEDLRPGGKITIVPAVEDLDFTWLRWANDERLVIAMGFSADTDADQTGQTRLIAADRDGTHIGSIIQADKRVKTGSRVPADMDPALVQDNVIDWLPEDPQHILISIDANHDEKMEVRKVNVRSGKFKVVQEGLPGVENWLADKNHDVRLGWGMLGSDVIVWYAEPGKKMLRSEGIAWRDIGFTPVAFTEEPNIVYAIGEDENGRNCIRKLNLTTGEFAGAVFEQDNADANALLVDAYSGNAVGVSYTEDQPMQTYFEQEMVVVQRTIDRAVPNASNRIVSTSADRRKILVYSENGSEPGAYYHWDRDAKSFELMGEAMRGWGGEFGQDDELAGVVADTGF